MCGVGTNRTSKPFGNGRGQTLHTVEFVPTGTCKAILIFHHGYGEHTGRYSHGEGYCMRPKIACPKAGVTGPTGFMVFRIGPLPMCHPPTQQPGAVMQCLGWQPLRALPCTPWTATAMAAQSPWRSATGPSYGTSSMW